MFYKLEMSQGEIAEALGCTRVTVNRRIAAVKRKMERLRKMLAESGQAIDVNEMLEIAKGPDKETQRLINVLCGVEVFPNAG